MVCEDMKTMKNEKGITLIELIVVVSVIVILVVALGFSYQGWIGGYRVESQIKEMYVDIMNARARAMQRNRTHFVTLTATSYTVYDDTDPAPDGNGVLAVGSDTQTLNKTLHIADSITWSAGTLEFTPRGLANSGSTICSNTDADADYNCMIISESRINLGKLNTTIPGGGSCTPSTTGGDCVAK